MVNMMNPQSLLVFMTNIIVFTDIIGQMRILNSVIQTVNSVAEMGDNV